MGNKIYFVVVWVINGVGLFRIECFLGIFVILGKFFVGVVSDGLII